MQQTKDELILKNQRLTSEDVKQIVAHLSESKTIRKLVVVNCTTFDDEVFGLCDLFGPLGKVETVTIEDGDLCPAKNVSFRWSRILFQLEGNRNLRELTIRFKEWNPILTEMTGHLIRYCYRLYVVSLSGAYMENSATWKLHEGLQNATYLRSLTMKNDGGFLYDGGEMFNLISKLTRIYRLSVNLRSYNHLSLLESAIKANRVLIELDLGEKFNSRDTAFVKERCEKNLELSVFPRLIMLKRFSWRIPDEIHRLITEFML